MTWFPNPRKNHKIFRNLTKFCRSLGPKDWDQNPAKKSPFSSDRNHTHHILVDYLKVSHQQASFIIGGFNLIFVYLIIILGSTSYNFWLVTVLMVTAIALAYFFYRYNYSFSNLKNTFALERAHKLEIYKRAQSLN